MLNALYLGKQPLGGPLRWFWLLYHRDRKNPGRKQESIADTLSTTVPFLITLVYTKYYLQWPCDLTHEAIASSCHCG